jgi:hypothetical protein
MPSAWTSGSAVSSYARPRIRRVPSKDIRAFSATAREKGVSSRVGLLGTVDAINLGRRERVTTMVREALGGNIAD